MLPQSLENKPQMIFMLMFSGTEHKYIIQVDQYKVINVLPHKIIHQPLKRFMGHYKVQVAVQCTQIDPYLSYKCCFLLSIFSKANLVVTTC